jgi:type IV pilus assembly protein PilY1
MASYAPSFHPVNRHAKYAALLSLLGLALAAAPATALNIAREPLFVTQSQPPAVLLTMGRDHKLYYEAYNDYSDLDENGTLDVGYKPTAIDYYGYFDSYKCYSYVSGEFVPEAGTNDTAKDNKNKRCTGTGRDLWSGDFLNYVTMSRMDALRKVLYGGYRSTDTTTKTVLERAFIPQDSHSFGKEYQSIARDGYDISEYTPLPLPDFGRYHLFANVTLTGVGSAPLMRVLQNSQFRVWEWLSIERPVAGDACATGANVRSNCVTASTTTGTWSTVPASAFQNLQIATYIGPATGYPANHTEFETWKSTYATPANAFGPAQSVADIDCNSTNEVCNPIYPTAQDNYVTIITGKITVPATQTYEFAVDGDDAIEVIINGTVVAGYYGGHGFCNCDTNKGTITLTAGTYDIEYRHQETAGGDGYRLRWNMGSITAVRNDYTVRVEVCKTLATDPKDALHEGNCLSYGSGANTTYKPSGLLHKYGADNSVYFGLLTGSYAANTDGGILRKNIEINSVSNEINADGTFSNANGMIATMNKLRIVGFRYSQQDYEGLEGATRYYNCGWIATRAMNSGECQMWGNPLGEMVYEAIRYFNGKTTPTSAFTANPGGNTNADTALGLPNPTWKDPYVASPTGGGLPSCSKPYVMAISDVYPSFDSDKVPGSAFDTVTTDLSGSPSVQTLGQKIWDSEFGAPKSVFMGQTTTDNFDSAPTAKTATTFGTLRGLAPGEPTRQGSYSTAALAYWAHMNDLSGNAGKERNLGFYSVALASPLPKIEVPVGNAGQKVTIVPFAKSVGGFSISSAQGAFQPTNQIVDFYVDTIRNVAGAPTDTAVNEGRPYYKFRINYEDVEQGADHDMDAIVVYEILLTSDNKVTVKLSSDYAAGSMIQHMGYVIAGTTADQIYLNVRDVDTTSGDPDYFLDTPNTTGVMLPLYSERTFTPSTAGDGVTILNDPLWYAAKWGGFKLLGTDGEPLDPDGTLRTPSAVGTWDADNNGVPDNYFLVVNPLKLETQLTNALNKILGEIGTAAALATNSSAWKQGAKLYQAKFASQTWYGEITSMTINEDGSLSSTSDDWRAEEELATTGASGRNIITYDATQTLGSRGARFNDFTSLPSAVQASLNRNSAGNTDGAGASRLSFLRGNSEGGMRVRPKIKDALDNDTSATNLLGDVVDSAIQYVGVPDFGYPDASYVSFRTAQSSRPAMLYVGANDGMLHGFAAADGVEKIAYIPSLMFRDARLSRLTDSDYGTAGLPHTYYVDGTPAAADVCDCGVSGCTGNVCPAADPTKWRTILVGGLNSGGQGIYAINITNPTEFLETQPNKVAMWEFSDLNDTDADTSMQYGLGYTFSRPAIVRVCTSRDSSAASTPKPCLVSRWAVIMGNGYNSSEADGAASTSGHAILYVLNAIDGSKIAKINTKAGSTASPNGLASIAVDDADGDGVGDYVYAGDLLGNMWKFDLTDSSTTNWGVAYGTTAVPAPLYIAQDASNNRQPITSAPELLTHTSGGVMVLFGTGLYLQEADRATTTQQTFYGIRDQGTSLSSADRNDLQEQEIVTPPTLADDGDDTNDNPAGFETSTRNTVDWSTQEGWYMDLPNSGERVAYDPVLFRSVLYFTSLQPSTDVCAPGAGTSWDTFVDGLTGSSLDYSVFVGVKPITGTDISGTAHASRRESTVGITPQGTKIDFGQGKSELYKGGSKEGEVEHFGLNPKGGSARREAWRELIAD